MLDDAMDDDDAYLPLDDVSDAASCHRKANKPLMEKRRRARINRSLSELKSILLENNKKSTPGHSKWEKADILEMTVQYVRCLRNQQKATNSDPLSIGQFIAGYSECVRQVQKFAPAAEPTACENDQLTDFLLSYLKSFSDDATQALGSSERKRRAPVERSPKPSPQHSPTCSTLSPKSESSGTSSAAESPLKPPPPGAFVTLLMPSSAGCVVPTNLLAYQSRPPPAERLAQSPVWRPW